MDVYDNTADEFLTQFDVARRAMKKANDLLLAASKNCTPADARRYRAVHKRMVRVTKDWNNIEFLRENMVVQEPRIEPAPDSNTITKTIDVHQQ